MRMSDKKIFALSQGHGMRRHGAQIVESGAGNADYMVFDGQNGFRDDGQIAFEEQVVNANDRTSESIFHGSKQRICYPIGDRAKSGVESGTRNRGDSIAEQLNGGLFAESAGFALKSHARLVKFNRHSHLPI